MRKNINNEWSIEKIWNDLITEERKIAPRSFIRASELGKAYLDRYLAMKGVQPTNKFPPRVLRIFDVGNIFETEVIERIFKLLGIFISTYREVYIQKNDYLPVIGHHDAKVGGVIKKEQALININHESVSPWLKLRATALLKKLLKEYPHGLRILTTEIKTVNSRAFWAPKNQDKNTGFFKGYPWHKLQIWTYLQTDDNDGRIFYISKDDLTLKEDPIKRDDKEIEELWMRDVSRMTRYYKKNIEPPPEKDIIYDPERGEYVLNWKIARSSYFTKITGFTVVEDWEKKFMGELHKKNTQKCLKCRKPFQLSTLNQYNGLCGRCFKGNGKEVKNNDRK